MKKYTLIFVVFFTGCTTLLNPYRGMIDQTSRTYVSDSLHLGFPIPPGWSLITMSGDSAGITFFPKIKNYSPLTTMTSKNRRAAMRMIVSSDKPAGLLPFLHSLAKTPVGHGYLLSGAYWIIKEKDSAAVVEYRKVDCKGQPCLLREFCFVQNGHQVRLQCTSLAVTFADYEPVFSGIIRNIIDDAPSVPSSRDGGTGGNRRWTFCGIAASDRPIDFITIPPTPASVVSYDALCIDSNLSTFWKVTSQNATVYILGSIHVAKPEIYPLKPAITTAFSRSDVLVVEVNTHKTDMKDAMQKFVSKMQYSDGGTISAHLSDSVCERLKMTCNNLGMPFSVYNHYQPWILSMSLSMAQLHKLGITGEYGIDDYFLSKAEKRRMEIQELETGESQLNLLYESCNIPRFLEYTLSDLDKMEQYIVPLIGAWKCGNISVLEAFTYTPDMAVHPEYGPFIEKLIFKRNRDFVAKIETYLKGDRTCFIVFGSGHAVGEKGVIRMLEQKGYMVRQL